MADFDTFPDDIHPFKNFKPRRNPEKRIVVPRGLLVAPGDLSQSIPLHPQYRVPLERFLYLDEHGMVVAQSIRFDGAEQECYLVLVKRNADKKWVWSSVVPAHEKRKSIWKSATTY